MRPGEILFATDPITLNSGRASLDLEVENTSDHTIFISSHFPFFEVNRRLVFDRALAWGMHLDLPAGDAMRWLPGEIKTVRLVPFAGRRVVRGFNGLTDGAATRERRGGGMRRMMEAGYAHRPAGGIGGRWSGASPLEAHADAADIFGEPPVAGPAREPDVVAPARATPPEPVPRPSRAMETPTVVIPRMSATQEPGSPPDPETATWAAGSTPPGYYPGPGAGAEPPPSLDAPPAADHAPGGWAAIPQPLETYPPSTSVPEPSATASPMAESPDPEPPPAPRPQRHIPTIIFRPDEEDSEGRPPAGG